MINRVLFFYRARSRNGFVLAIVILTMVLIGILIPMLYYMTNRETKWAVTQKHATVASQLAAAGIDRALWKLKETNDNWIDLLSSGLLAGYNNDVNYRDVNDENGIYRVQISTTADRNVMLLVATAKDTRANVYKAVQAFAHRTQIGAAVHGYQLFNSTSTAGIFTVHWGPIYATGNLFLNTIDVNQLYPRKFSCGSITVVNSTGSYASRDDSPSAPNSDGLEYYAYSTVPPIVTPDFDFYRDSATAMGTRFTANKTLSSTVTAPGQIFFFEKNATFQGNNKFIQGIIIVMGKCTLNGDNTVPTSPSNAYTVTPSTGALEYQMNCPIRKNAVGGSAYGDTAAVDEYPGDGGLNTYHSFTFGTTTGGASGKLVSIKGFLYVGTELAGGNTNSQVIHGALALSKNATISSGKFEVFYDPSLEIRTAASEIYLDQWKEITPTPF